MTAKTLMIQGTTSSAGKSLLTTALCHLFARRGHRVAPFKAQNMSNNAAVCPDGAEIGRAQAVQAVAAGLQPTATMNPILIKPEHGRAQLILMGRPWQTLTPRDYGQTKQTLWQTATNALDTLRAQYDLVIIEGAGSPVELNLKENDIVNMAIARYANSPVLLVGDIDRGGVFAQLLGTLWLLPPAERALVRGLVVNKFRGDMSLFTAGVTILEEKGEIPVLAVLPYLHNLAIPEEDAVSLDTLTSAQPTATTTDIAIIHLPCIANFDDFDPLGQEPAVSLRYITHPDQLGHPHAIILPGTKSTIADLNWLRQTGLADAITHHANQGTPIVGICGGYQMLGQSIRDDEGVEGETAVVPGLDLLPITTRFYPHKQTHRVTAVPIYNNHPAWLPHNQQPLTGYEIHMGHTTTTTPWLHLTRPDNPTPVADGATSHNGRIWGCYLHGLFANDHFRHHWLTSLGWEPTTLPTPDLFAASLTRLADTIETHFDMTQLEKIIWDN
ncbi:MAG TPA: cobyric acid synthase [Anaerolineae bacterium]|nr:cobyric acid synthase [Anaerolineae bacterium]